MPKLRLTVGGSSFCFVTTLHDRVGAASKFLIANRFRSFGLALLDGTFVARPVR